MTLFVRQIQNAWEARCNVYEWICVCGKTACFLCVGGENAYKSKVTALKRFTEAMHYFDDKINDTNLLFCK